jgi:hypothetical protein
MAEELKLITVEKKSDPPKPEKKSTGKAPAKKAPAEKMAETDCKRCVGHPGVYIAPNGWQGICNECGGEGVVKVAPKKRRKKARVGIPTTLVLALLCAAVVFVLLHFHILDSLRSPTAHTWAGPDAYAVGARRRTVSTLQRCREAPE